MPDQNPFAGIDPLVKSPPYDPTAAQEKIRGAVTLVAVSLFTLILAMYIGAALSASDDHWKRLVEAMQSVLPAVTSILGTVIGFYFGAQKR